MFCTPFYSNTMKYDQLLQILRFLHVSNNMDHPDKNDKLWKMRILFDQLNDAYAKFYSPSAHLAVNEVIVLIKGRVIFKQDIPKKQKCFHIKIYKQCDMTWYTYNMRVYLGNCYIHGRVTGNWTAMIWEDKKYTHWQRCTDCQQKATFERNMGNLKNQSPIKSIVSTQATLSNRTEWLTATQLVG